MMSSKYLIFTFNPSSFWVIKWSSFFLFFISVAKDFKSSLNLATLFSLLLLLIQSNKIFWVGSNAETRNKKTETKNITV